MPKLIKLNAKGKAAPPTAKRFPGVLQVVEGGANLIWDPRETKAMDYANAEKYIAQLNKDEPETGWRLPTVDELFSLADRTKHSPAIDTRFFPKCQRDWYWTSTPAAYSPADCAWVVSFYNGYAHWLYRASHAFVRAVRPSQ
jgi:hypothetical protein